MGIGMDSRSRGNALVGRYVFTIVTTRNFMRLRRTVTLGIAIPVAIAALLLARVHARALQQDQSAKKFSQVPTIEEYQPKSTLVTKEHKVERAKFPFIDIHSHHWNPTVQASQTKGAPEWMPMRRVGGSGMRSQPSIVIRNQ